MLEMRGQTVVFCIIGPVLCSIVADVMAVSIGAFAGKNSLHFAAVGTECGPTHFAAIKFIVFFAGIGDQRNKCKKEKSSAKQ